MKADVVKQVFVYMHLRDFFAHSSTTTVYARSPFYPSLRFTLSLQSAVCILHTVLHFAPGPESESAFYTDRMVKGYHECPLSPSLWVKSLLLMRKGN